VTPVARKVWLPTRVVMPAALAGDANEMSVVGAQEDPAYQAILGDAWTLYVFGWRN